VLHALELHPATPDQWYAGFDCDLVGANAGLYETTDGGKTWQRPAALRGKGVWSIAFSASVQRIGAGTTTGVFWNTGEGWQRISPESNQELRPVVSLAFDPDNENTLFAGTTHLPWRTLDGGQTWTSIHSGMLDDSDVFSISPDRSRKGLVYASACSGAYRSSTGGSTWIRLPTPRGAFRVYLVTPDPHRPQVLYAATSTGLLRSTNAGGAWTKLISDIVHSVSFHPVIANRIYVASATAGILTSSQGGDNFQPVNRGFSYRPFRSLRASRNLIYVTAPIDGPASLFLSVDQGTTWHSDPAWPRNLRFVAIQEGISGTVFIASSTRVYASPKPGTTWTPLPDFPGGRVSALEATKAGVLAGGPKGLFAWTSASPVWKPVPLPEAVSVHGLYAGWDGFLGVSADSAVLISTDDGATWRACSGIPNVSSIYNLAGSGGEQGFVLMGTTGGLLRSEDGCRTWADVRGGLNGDTVSVVSVGPAQTSLTFAVQDDRAFISGDRGHSWNALADEGRLGDFPQALHVTAGSSMKLFALFSRAGVMVQDLAAADFKARPPGS
jgi:photosystem II stability/assembly factor-like uncharacterized protein